MSGVDRLYLDLDGVFTDFHKSALEVHGADASLYPSGVYDMEEHLNISLNEFWIKIDSKGEDFWSHMPLIEESMKLWEAVKDYDPIILTAPCSSPWSDSGKKKFIARVFGRGQIKRTILCPSRLKCHLALSPKQDCVNMLVDDSEDNVREFNDCGGMGMLWPSVGNWMHDYDKDDCIDRILDRINE